MDVKVRMILLAVVFIGALNWGVVALGANPIESLTKSYSKIIYLVIGLSAIILLIFSHRETFLPFLGSAAFPCGLLEAKVPKQANLEVSISTTPNTRILYWAAQPGEDLDRDWTIAYANYHNSGVVFSNALGEATLPVIAPGGYTVPRKTLLPHVHYRTCQGGLLGPVETIDL